MRQQRCVNLTLFLVVYFIQIGMALAGDLDLGFPTTCVTDPQSCNNGGTVAGWFWIEDTRPPQDRAPEYALITSMVNSMSVLRLGISLAP